MLSWTRLFLGLALITGLLGFTGRAGSASGLACDLCAFFVLLVFASLIGTALRARPPL